MSNYKPPAIVIEAIRVILGMNAQGREERREARKQARQDLKLWLRSVEGTRFNQPIKKEPDKESNEPLDPMDPIPNGVFYNPLIDDFVNCFGVGKGISFRRYWYNQKDEFPVYKYIKRNIFGPLP